MNAPDDYCDFCDLPRAQCIHGSPRAPPLKATPTPRAARTSPRSPAARPATPTRSVPRRWTAPEALRPLILSVLDGAGGELDADEMFLELEVRMADQFLSGDQERTPEGELRWQYAARKARVELIKDGLMTKGRPGVWQLAGR